MTDVFEQMMRDVGACPDSIIADGERHYFGRKMKYWYIVRINEDGSRILVYNTYKNPCCDYFSIVLEIGTKTHRRTPRPKLIMANSLVNQKTPLSNDPSTCENDFELFKDCPKTFPYLLKKGVGLHGDVRYSEEKGFMAVPIYGPHWEFRGYQRIFPDGSKLLAKGTVKAGGFFFIQGKGKFVFCGEGYATCSSIHEASGCSVIMAVDCGNIKAAIESFHHATNTPYDRIVVVADNDANHAGEKGAQAAVDALGVRAFVIPNCGNPAISDANDFARVFGLNALNNLLGGDCLKEATT